MDWLGGSDAEQFASQRDYDDDAQITALRLFLACDEQFAEAAYKAGIRWFSHSGRSAPAEDFEFALERLGLTSGWWLTDTWTGRDVLPKAPALLHGSLEDRQVTYRELLPALDGRPGFPGLLLPPSSTVRAAGRTREELLASQAESVARLDYAIPSWHPRNSVDLAAVIGKIADAVAPSRLWFRGQTTQHVKERDRGVMDWLELPASDMSLIPSIARPGDDAMPADAKEAARWAWAYDFVWRAPVLAWLAEQPGYAPADPDARKQLDEITDDVHENIGEALGLIAEHPELDALDDLRQWWIMGSGRSRAMPLWLQHYGARTTVLDLTSSLDVALYFARRTWSQDAAEFIDAPAHPTAPCVLVFAERPGWSVDEFIIDSAALVRELVHDPIEMTPRVKNQACGLLTGASFQAHNRAADLVIAVIELDEFEFGSVLADSFVFPPPDQDSLFTRMLRTRPEPPGLKAMRFGH